SRFHCDWPWRIRTSLCMAWILGGEGRNGSGSCCPCQRSHQPFAPTTHPSPCHSMKRSHAMRRILLSLALLLPLAAVAADNDVSTVNGSVHVGDHAVVQKASTVNGSVDLGAQARAGELGTVNGAIRLAAG